MLRGGCLEDAFSFRPKFPDIAVQSLMKHKVFGNYFRKFWSTSWGCPFLRKFGNSASFLFHLGFVTLFVTLFGKTGLNNENSVVMFFQCDFFQRLIQNN